MSVDTTSIFVPTPMVEELHNTIKRWTFCGFTGGIIIGDARLGKSWAVRALGNELFTPEGEPIRIFYTQFARRDTQTLRSVYIRISRAIGQVEISKSATADVLQDSLFHVFAEAALSNSRRQVILIADETQELDLIQLNVFAELFNDQDFAHNRMAIYCVANAQRFRPMAKQLLQEENQYLRERFFHNIHRFYGIRNFHELRHCLAFFDRHQTGETKNFVAYFCPEMTASGKTLEDLAGMIWEIYDERYAQPLGLKSWGMTYFQRAILILIMDYLSHYWRDNADTLRSLIDKSIAASGIVPSIKSAC